jgi:hypothetical protein
MVFLEHHQTLNKSGGSVAFKKTQTTSQAAVLLFSRRRRRSRSRGVVQCKPKKVPLAFFAIVNKSRKLHTQKSDNGTHSAEGVGVWYLGFIYNLPHHPTTAIKFSSIQLFQYEPCYNYNS